MDTVYELIEFLLKGVKGIGGDIEPIVIIVQVIIGFSVVWGFFRYRVFANKVVIKQISEDTELLRKQKKEWDTTLNGLKFELDVVQSQLPDTVLEIADQEHDQGRTADCLETLTHWSKRSAGSIAEICRRLAEWQVAFLPNENNTLVLADTNRFIKVGLGFSPTEINLRRLAGEVSAIEAVGLENRGAYSIADRLWQRALEYVGNLTDDDVQALVNRASVADRAGDYYLSKILWERTLIHCQRTLVRNHPSILAIRNNLASALSHLGRSEEAKKLLRETLQAQKDHPELGPKHPETLASQNNLAIALNELGHSEEAKKLLRETLQAQKDHSELGPNHTSTLTSQNN